MPIAVPKRRIGLVFVVAVVGDCQEGFPLRMGRLAKEAVIHQLAPSGLVGINIHDLTKMAFFIKKSLPLQLSGIGDTLLEFN